jgi:hypothetical protein
VASLSQQCDLYEVPKAATLLDTEVGITFPPPLLSLVAWQSPKKSARHTPLCVL